MKQNKSFINNSTKMKQLLKIYHNDSTKIKPKFCIQKALQPPLPPLKDPSTILHAQHGPLLNGEHGPPQHPGVVVVEGVEDPLGAVLQLLHGGRHGAVNFLLSIIRVSA